VIGGEEFCVSLSRVYTRSLSIVCDIQTQEPHSTVQVKFVCERNVNTVVGKLQCDYHDRPKPLPISKTGDVSRRRIMTSAIEIRTHEQDNQELHIQILIISLSFPLRIHHHHTLQKRNSLRMPQIRERDTSTVSSKILTHRKTRPSIALHTTCLVRRITVT
jgi:hypothetical protein